MNSKFITTKIKFKTFSQINWSLQIKVVYLLFKLNWSYATLPYESLFISGRISDKISGMSTYAVIFLHKYFCICQRDSNIWHFIWLFWYLTWKKFHVNIYLEASEPKWVNPVLNTIGVNSLKLGGLHLVSYYSRGIYTDKCMKASEEE